MVFQHWGNFFYWALLFYSSNCDSIIDKHKIRKIKNIFCNTLTIFYILRLLWKEKSSYFKVDEKNLLLNKILSIKH